LRASELRAWQARVVRAIFPIASCTYGCRQQIASAAQVRPPLALGFATMVAAPPNTRVTRLPRNTTGFFVHAQNRTGGSALHLGFCLATTKYLNGRNLDTSPRACGSLGRDLSNASAR